MPFWLNLRLGLKALFSKARQNRDLDQELDAFLDAATAEKVRSGLDHETASRAARVEMGSREAVKEEVRSVGWEAALDGMWQDLRFSIRMLAKSPGFSAVAIVSLALGIGANTAMFTLVNGLILRSLPVRAPSELVAFGHEVGGGMVDGITPGSLDLFPYEFYQRIKDNHTLVTGLCAYASFTSIVSFRTSSATGSATGQPARQGLSHLVSGNFFQVLGASPLLGRALNEYDSQAPDREPVAVVSYRFWQENLGGDPGAVGRSIVVNSTPFIVVGIMPANFFGVSVGDNTPDFWLPLTMQTEVTLGPSQIGPRALYWLHFMARRQPGVSLGRIQSWAKSELHHYMMEREGPVVSPKRKREIAGIFVEALPGDRGISVLRAQYSEPLQVLMGLVSFVLLIACANLANLLLARASFRDREISTRLALGCSRFRILRQFLTEAVLLAFAGGALGLLVSYLGTRALIKFVAGNASQTDLSAVPDARVLLFTLSVSFVAGLLFGLAPALSIGRLSAVPAAQASVRSALAAGGRTGRRVPKLLIIFQVTLSLVLVASAALFVRTLHNLDSRDFGFNRRKVLLMNFNAKFAGYKWQQLNALYTRMIETMRAVPGVTSASLSGSPPINGGNWVSPIFFQGDVPVPTDTLTLLNRVAPGYFETVGIPLLRGRTFSYKDSANATKVVVVNQSFANYFFPKGDALGHIFTVADPSVKGAFQIVGVVRNAKYSNPREQPQRMTYLPVMQLTEDDVYAYVLELQTAGEPSSVAAAARRALAAMDSNLPILATITLAEQTDRQIANEILISQLSGFFSLLALSLACIGLYGVMTYNVLRRYGEIGVRLTLGAQAPVVLWMILRESLLLLTAGLALGLPATLAFTRLFRSQLFGLTPSDPASLLAAVLIIAASVLISAYFPARRATRVDPMLILR